MPENVRPGGGFLSIIDEENTRLDPCGECGVIESLYKKLFPQEFAAKTFNHSDTV